MPAVVGEFLRQRPAIGADRTRKASAAPRCLNDLFNPKIAALIISDITSDLPYGEELAYIVDRSFNPCPTLMGAGTLVGQGRRTVARNTGIDEDVGS